ncbi:hypothetical protein [Streptomyces sp. NPDC053367]
MAYFVKTYFVKTVDDTRWPSVDNSHQWERKRLPQWRGGAVTP